MPKAPDPLSSPRPDEIGDTVYAELRRVAARYLRRERPNHTLQPTALVHEAWMRLASQRDVDWVSRDQFIALASTYMRRILVDHARRRARQRRGAGAIRVLLEDVQIPVAARDVEVVALDLALGRLETLDPRAAKVVEYRYFGGFTAGEIAEALATSPATVERDWRHARAWLWREMTEGDSA